MPERTIPILPTRSIDDTLDFYRALGFAVTYQQERPNTYAVVERGGIELQFFVLKALEPAESYSSCYVLTSDVDTLYQEFTDGQRRAPGLLADARRIDLSDADRVAIADDLRRADDLTG